MSVFSLLNWSFCKTSLGFNVFLNFQLDVSWKYSSCYMYIIYIYTCVCIAPKIKEAFQWISRGHLFVLKVVYVRPNFQKKNQQPRFPWNFRGPISRNQKKHYQNSGAKKVLFSVATPLPSRLNIAMGSGPTTFAIFGRFFAPISTEIWSEHKGFRPLRGTGKRKKNANVTASSVKRWNFRGHEGMQMLKLHEWEKYHVFLCGKYYFMYILIHLVFWFCSTDSYENNVVTLQCISRLIGWWIKSWSLKPNVKLRHPVV